jgi:hypothetical protein
MEIQNFSEYDVERRRAQRYLIVCPVELKNGTATTRNQSTTGVLFETDRPFTVGDPIDLSITLERYENNLTRIRCQGKVVRVEPCPRGWLIAVDIGSFYFIA